MKSTSLSIEHLYDLTAPLLSEELGGAPEGKSSVLSSPELLDLLVWNVVVSFAVSIASNAAFGALKALFSRKGRLDTSDLTAHGQLIRHEELEIEIRNEAVARQVVATVLHQYVRSEELSSTTTRVVSIMIETVRTRRDTGDAQ